MPPKNTSDFVEKSHGYWDYPDPVLHLMDMLSSKTQKRALQNAINNLCIDELCHALCESEEERIKHGLNGIPEGLRKQISDIIYNYESADLHFDEVKIASVISYLGIGCETALYARRHGNLIVYRCITDGGTVRELKLSRCLTIEEVPEYLGFDMDYVDESAIEEISEKIEKKLNNIDDRVSIRKAIYDYYGDNWVIQSNFYLLENYIFERWIDSIEKGVVDCMTRP